MTNLVKLFHRTVVREGLLQIRHLRLLVHSCLFFLMMIIFFPLTLQPSEDILRSIVPGLVWVALLLAMLLSAEHLFQGDYDDGVIEQWLVSAYPVSILVLAKVLVHWLLIIVPIILICPILAVLFALSGYEMVVVMLSLISGSPAILFLCALSVVFSTGLNQKGVLMALVLLPLTIPIMIFGSSTITAAMEGLPIHGHIAMLLALSLIAGGLLPFATAALIRVCLVD